jgi:hypothetical protein
MLLQVNDAAAAADDDDDDNNNEVGDGLVDSCSTV